MNTETMFSSKTDLWATPQDFYDKLNSEFHFTLDPCATPHNAKCVKFYTKEQDGLRKDWGGNTVFAIRHTVGIYTHGFVNASWRHKNQHNSCNVDSGAYRYSIFSRIYLPQSTGN